MKKILIPALLCLTLAAGCTCENTIRRRADVLVIGGTTSGTTAAIAAARQGVQTLVLDQTDAELIHGKRIVIVDDVISTGESLRAMEELVNEAGGIIVGKMAVLAEGDANDRPDITVLGKLPLFNPDGTPKA